VSQVFLTKEERAQGVILIPVKPMVRRYLLAHYEEPIHISGKNACGQLLLALDLDLPDLPPLLEGGLVPVKFRFALRHVRREYHKDPRRLHGGQFCWALFAQTMITWVDAQTQAGRDAWGSLRDFLESYAITEEEYSLESAYRYWLKYRPCRVGESPRLVVNE